MIRKGLLAFAFLASYVAVACGGDGRAPGKTALDASALGKQRCVAEGDEQRLFVVDWDATDLAAFESRAGRDVVLVKYEGCKVSVKSCVK